MVLSAEIARSLLPNINITDIDEYIDIDYLDRQSYIRKLFYLGYQCCRGDYDRIFDFIQNTNDLDELSQLLNDNTLYEFYYGTVLHLVLYWNTGEQAQNLYNLLVKHGAKPCENYYEALPWTQEGCEWVPPLGGGGGSIGQRDISEFKSTYESFIHNASE